MKTLDIAVDMFNLNPAFGNLTVEFLLFFRQLMIFGSLDGNRTVGMEFLQALKAFILHGFNLFRHMGFTVFIQLEIMRFSRTKESAYDIARLFIRDDLDFHRMPFFLPE